jgi:pimeloyl-ACP methyl ester carboxylesterase
MVRSLESKLVNIGSARLNCKLFGHEKRNIVVIENALSSCSAEWWHIAEDISQRAIVLTYDRAGYGRSSASDFQRTPRNIAKELHALLEKLKLVDKITLVGHSQGGLYAQQFARDYPDMVRSLVLLDPLSANDSHFHTLLTEKEFAQSGVDKTKGLKIGALLCSIGLGPVLKPILKKGIPFYYYDNFVEEAKEYILYCLTKAKHYRTALEEYRISHLYSEIDHLKSKEGFPDIPITLITHSSNIYIEEIMKYGRSSREIAEKVEKIWQEIMKEYLNFSNNTKWIEAKKSSHFMHLTEPELVKDSIYEVL